MLINKNKYTFPQIKDIIDSYLQDSQSFMFVADFAMAHCIYDYIHNDYGIVATAIELSSDIDEYYVSLQFYNNGDMDFVCEYSKGNDGNYKYDEADEIHYFVFSSMSFGDVREFLSGSGELEFCELVDEEYVEDMEVENGNMMDEENYIPCPCPDCVDERKVIFIAEAVDMVFKEGLCCPQCLYELFESVYDKGHDDGFDQGFEECKEEMREFLED